MDAPVAFVSHGAPSLALDAADPTHAFLRGFGDALAASAHPQGCAASAHPEGCGKPRAILCISAHWDTVAPALTAGDEPATIHDFYGFPEPLYALRYPAPGSPALALRVRELLAAAGHDAHLDLRRGLDHGAWLPLMLMYPEAEVPVVQLSVQSQASGAHHLAIGRALAPLRAEGILVFGSGGATHPLGEALRATVEPDEGSPAEWTAGFDRWLTERIEQGDRAALADWHQAPHAERNHPTPEHFVPLLVAAGAAGEARGSRVHAGWAYRHLSMAAFRWH